MIILFTILHVIVCLFLIVVVLLQSGKAADLAGAFGGMGSQTAFGPRGAATLLSKATTIAAALFMVTSLSLSVMYTRMGSGSTGNSVLEKAPVTAPVTPKKSEAPKTMPIEMEVDGKKQTVNMPVLPEKKDAATPAPAPAPKK